MSTPDWPKLLVDCVQTAAIVFGGLFALYEYRRFRRYSPKIQFKVDFDLHPIDDKSGNYLLNIEVTVKNVGQVRMYFPEICVSVRTLGRDDLEVALDSKKRFYFKRELVPKHNIVYKPNDPWWVDPGVTQVFPYPVAIKQPNNFVQVNTEFFYYRNIKKYLKIIEKQDDMRKEGNKVKEKKDKIREGYHQASLIKAIMT